ncbi:hypothetical protein JCM10908_002677 [Rhodotorula pacifica]|uniref:uncharacterized protein n=1 Tax=Rhodotorula pacifica TaxID=1495444 RepID=UPI00317C2443
MPLREHSGYEAGSASSTYMYYNWYLSLLSKIARLVTDTKSLPDARHFPDLREVGLIMKEWEGGFRRVLTPRWIMRLEKREKEAVFRKLYGLAVQVFDANTASGFGGSCQEAARTAIACTPEVLRTKLELPEFVEPFLPPPKLPHPFPCDATLPPAKKLYASRIARQLTVLTTTWLFANLASHEITLQRVRVTRWRERVEEVLTSARLEEFSFEEGRLLMRLSIRRDYCHLVFKQRLWLQTRPPQKQPTAPL